MKPKKILLATAFCSILSSPASAQAVLTGDTATACEAMMCLIASIRPTECNKSLARYFSITARKWSDTLKQRTDFLDMCPTASNDPQMKSLIPAIVNGAGRCDAATLNQTTVANYSNDSNGNQHFYIPNAMPAYCTAYTQHPYADLKITLPLYVGTPDRDGYWVERAQYAKAVDAYAIQIAAQDAAIANQRNDGGGR